MRGSNIREYDDLNVRKVGSCPARPREWVGPPRPSVPVPVQLRGVVCTVVVEVSS